MNSFSDALETFGGPGKLARSLGITTQAVCFWRDGKRRIPADQCYRIERAMGGLITRQVLRPKDWQEIWPELVAGYGEPAEPLAAVMMAPAGEGG
ncbi:transcriptional regulator [Xylophilus ampelinus]|uniref:YdaS antitoxin of YdaST toxin-antitoxin system n=1 Tax=Xylophilus ampelinus TaxID=54067 RepID=A0A318SLE2_9BURK|nr:Cro/CI family transcriptional regulator [Xylophilus ampelinus]MCS4509159.1 helix-turn-helix domain-containing protein [Xylophilus ampelinus]PYE79815.1 YdaS antitoxin of YdaST toxin-antitoxin system [Xylophilus ampelinus]